MNLNEKKFNQIKILEKQMGNSKRTRKQSPSKEKIVKKLFLLIFLSGCPQIPVVPPSSAPPVVNQTISGIDVSDYDPGTNWTKVSGDGLSFAFIKATEGINFLNNNFSTDWVSAKQNNILRGAYHVYHGNQDPTLQAQYYLQIVGELSFNDLPPMLDLEQSTMGGVSFQQEAESIQTWLDIVEKSTGKVPLIYSDPDFFSSLNLPQSFSRYPLYIAEYDVSSPRIPVPWTSWTFWQSGAAPINGVTASQCDVDQFIGTLDQLKNFSETGSL